MKNIVIVLVLLLLTAPLYLSGADIELPEGLKGLVPVYPKATVVVSMKAEEGPHAQLEVNAKPKDVIDFYKKAMKGKGWSVDMDMSTAESGTVVLGKGGRALNIMAIGSSGEKTRVVLALTKK